MIHDGHDGWGTLFVWYQSHVESSVVCHNCTAASLLMNVLSNHCDMQCVTWVDMAPRTAACCCAVCCSL